MPPMMPSPMMPTMGLSCFANEVSGGLISIRG
jgi:hypothetical protein